jgi:hypothetical protein
MTGIIELIGMKNKLLTLNNNWALPYFGVEK